MYISKYDAEDGVHYIAVTMIVFAGNTERLDQIREETSVRLQRIQILAFRGIYHLRAGYNEMDANFR